MYPPDPTVINIVCRRAFSTTPKRQKTHYGIPSASRRYFGPLPALQHGLLSPSRLRCGRSRQYGAHLAAPSRWELPGWVRTAAAADVDSPPVGAHSAADLPASPRLQHRPRRRRIVIRFIVRSVNNVRASKSITEIYTRWACGTQSTAQYCDRLDCFNSLRYARPYSYTHRFASFLYFSYVTQCRLALIRTRDLTDLPLSILYT